MKQIKKEDMSKHKKQVTVPEFYLITDQNLDDRYRFGDRSGKYFNFKLALDFKLQHYLYIARSTLLDHMTIQIVTEGSVSGWSSIQKKDVEKELSDVLNIYMNERHILPPYVSILNPSMRGMLRSYLTFRANITLYDLKDLRRW